MTTPDRTAPPTFTAVDRRALASVAVQFFVNGAIFSSYVPRLPEIRERIGVSLGTIGVLITVALSIGLIGSVLMNRLATRYRTRTVLIVGATVLVATLPSVGFATSPWVFVIATGVLATFDVVVDVAMNLQGSWLSARRHVPVMNRLHGLWSLGAVAGGVGASRAAAAGVSLQTHLVVVSVLLLCSLVFVGRGLLTVDEHPDHVEAGDDTTTGSEVVPSVDVAGPTVMPFAGEHGGTPAPTPRPRAGVTSRLALVSLALAGACAITVEIVSADWAAFRLSEDLGAAIGFAGLAYVCFTVGMTAGRFAGDWVLSRLGPQRLLWLASGVTVVGVAGAGLVDQDVVVLASYAVAGLGVATFFPKLYDDAAQLPGLRGAGLAWMTVGSRTAALVVPALVGSLAATDLSVGQATALVSVPCAVGFLVMSTIGAGAGRAARPDRSIA